MSKYQRGVSLLEILIVLGLSAVVATGVLIGMQRGQDTADEGVVTSQVTTLVQAVRDLHRGQDSYEDLSTAQLIDAGVIPTGWQGPSNTIVSGSGTIDVQPVDRLGYENGAFAITVNQVSRTTCQRLAVDTSGMFSTFQVNGTMVRADNLDPVSVDEAISACTADRRGSIRVIGTGW